MSQETKRQHYVPQTYLKNFAFKRKKNKYILHFIKPEYLEKGSIQSASIKDLCVNNELYTLPGITGEERMLVESFYSDTYESGWTGVYRKLTNEHITEVTTEDRRLIIGMVCSLFFRNLSWKRFYDQFMGETIQKVYDLSVASGQEVFDFEGEEVSIKGKTADTIKNEMWIRDKPGFIVTQTLASIKLLKLRIESDGIVVMKIQNLKQQFITSDRPVALRDPEDQRLIPINPKNFVSLPLDHTHMLLLIPERPRENILEVYRNNASDVDPFVWNAQQHGPAHKYLMGSERGLLQYCESVRRVNSRGS